MKYVVMIFVLIGFAMATQATQAGPVRRVADRLSKVTPAKKVAGAVRQRSKLARKAVKRASRIRVRPRCRG